MNNALLIACIVLLTVVVTLVLVLIIVILFTVRNLVKEARELMKKIQCEVEKFENIASKTGRFINLFRPSIIKLIIPLLGGLFGFIFSKKRK
ncbi:MAG: hypothetical protein AUJ85_02100 [Elusimicrobia bacterium CG1_02_37_114]|nr:MAG: hypothetical protein AUJ85_02100 [Elusimicrobia bacterium CG1_02_37_114]PIV53069.1 MAG: hypothetical protein COS17_05975 [Elusimicrobia bacterium CG02_land_8_20_14_3_00_37_13]PIZ12758.1 MAG: hypothetical protein COY53_08370 [Elusimicrobia bacterium CG_4_10_14_0_8_um_filter_37_32]